jgi:hypothetical protein
MAVKARAIQIGEFKILLESTSNGLYKAAVETRQEIVSYGKTGNAIDVILHAVLKTIGA